MARRKNHPGSISKRGPSYRVRLCVDGERHYFTLKEVTRLEAEDFARDKFKELQVQAERKSLGLPTGVTFHGLLDRFKEDVMPTLTDGTQRSYRDSFKPFKTFFVKRLEDPRVAKIRPGHIRDYMTWRRSHGPTGRKRKKPLSNRTVEKDRAVLHRLFDYATELELRDGNPVAPTERPKSDGREPVILTEEQLTAFLDKAEGHDMLQTYIVFLAETGARCESEALWVQWEDVDLQEGFVWLASGRDGHRTKSGKGRWVPLTKRLRETLRDHAAKYRLRTYGNPPERSPWVFHHIHSMAKVTAGDRIQSLRASFNRAAEDAKLPSDFVQHDLRHRRVTTWLAEGQSPAIVQKALGHADIRTTLGYSHRVRQDLRQLVQKDEEREKAKLKELAQ